MRNRGNKWVYTPMGVGPALVKTHLVEQVDRGGAAASREQEGGIEVTAGGGREHSFE